MGGSNLQSNTDGAQNRHRTASVENRHIWSLEQPPMISAYYVPERNPFPESEPRQP